MKILIGITYITYVIAQSTQNPFENKPWALNTLFIDKATKLGIENDPAVKFASGTPSTVWLDKIERVLELDDYMKKTGNDTISIMVYDNCGRDCAADGSVGELHCESPTCEECIEIYKNKFILPIKDVLKNYPQKTKILFLETDALPNSVTNFNNKFTSECSISEPPKCNLPTITAYFNAIIIAINELSVDENTFFILDTGLSNWIGWSSQQQYDNRKRATSYPDINVDGNAQFYVHNVKEIFKSTPETTELKLKSRVNNVNTFYSIPLLYGGLKNGVMKYVRGFASNIANRQRLLDRSDICGLAEQYNFAIDELSFVDMMDSLWKQEGYTFGWVIDTSRNNGDNRVGNQCGSWCNVPSYMGELPQIPDKKVWNKETGYVFNTSTNKYNDNQAQIDAFWWIKTPGETDGCSLDNGECFRNDCMCRLYCDNPKLQFCNQPEAGEISIEQLHYWYNK